MKKEKGSVCLSFDDGRGDNRYIAEKILLPMNIPATFNITTGYVDGSCSPADRPSIKKPMTIDDVRWIAEHNIFEIAMHGDEHKNTLEDIIKCRNKLATWLGLKDDDLLGFASPGTGLNIKTMNDNEKEMLFANTTYIRLSLRLKRFVALKVVSRKLARILHIPILYKLAYSDTMLDTHDTKMLYSVPVLKTTTPQEIRRMVTASKTSGKAVILMFHSICEGTRNDDNWTWEQQRFINICRFICREREEGNINVLKVSDLYKYFNCVE